MSNGNDRQAGTQLRVAFIAGTLGKGGAEKQLVYMVRALQQAGVLVRVYCLTQNEYYEQALRDLGVPPVWIGQHGNPILRIFALWKAVSSYRPHILQSSHFYTNLYAKVVGQLLGIVSIGAIRSSGSLELQLNKFWSKALLRMPDTIISNSHLGREIAILNGIHPDRIAVLANVIDLEMFDRERTVPAGMDLPNGDNLKVALIARLVFYKRGDRFLRALALAIQQEPALTGLIIGEGEERGSLENLAADLRLGDKVSFLGERHDIPALTSHFQVLMLTSDEEGFPNVILESMAAGLPVITTAAAEAALAVQDGQTGFVVPFGPENIMVQQLADRLVQLVRQPELRTRFGQAGRKRVEQNYSLEGLAPRLIAIYRQFASLQKDKRLVQLLEGEGVYGLAPQDLLRWANAG